VYKCGLDYLALLSVATLLHATHRKVTLSLMYCVNILLVPLSLKLCILIQL